MKSKKQAKMVMCFALSMMDKLIEFKSLQIEEHELKNKIQEEKDEKEWLQNKSSKATSASEEGKEPLKDLFSKMGEIFNPNENEKELGKILENKFPSGGIIVGLGKRKSEEERENGEEIICMCPRCVAKRQSQSGRN